MEPSVIFERERPRLLRIAAHVLGDPVEAEDIVQTTWLRLHGATARIENLPGWLTTVVTRLCLDRLRSRTPTPYDDPEPVDEVAPDPAEEVALADTVGVALQVVLDRLGPRERVALVLHDVFGVEFATVAEILSTSTANARQLASRARTKVSAGPSASATPDWVVVDAFLAAAREGDFARLLALLAPDAVVAGDAAAVAAGTPSRVEGRETVATMFDGAAKAALPMFVEGRPGAAWVHRGETRVVFDFTVEDGVVVRIDFRADPDLLARVVRRRAAGLR